ncbi:hypothetical protein [Lacticaseibacillus zeae]|uniref:Uncharacterized protein n=1 Tax=Lacticaseibacillus zeae subsp. silagei TaxID=3068307 RepID=A0ABD7ZB20_LACZE|nr:MULTISPECIES: hypothetical protein [Lacticaseibacillus]MDE3314499.1 hypothetical protein [Lacticaseibacillus zeae]OFR97483.1 hypothetical protein HMPREF2861_01220 [Lactobacillus sp. HMSC068F07]WLV84126.1 hypothetical protein LACZS2_000535 [Lacticaseibacillus sp. NCIMB 15475]WLV86881.1 hypothetical protein LACZS1_000534 [Lacticaseibacillus sp. NCIMB 15474]
MNNMDVFKNRYKHILTFLGFWIAGYFTLDSLFSGLPLPLTVFSSTVVPISFLSYLIYDYFKLKIKRPASLIFLVVMIAAFIFAILLFLKIVVLF